MALVGMCKVKSKARRIDKVKGVGEFEALGRNG